MIFLPVSTDAPIYHRPLGTILLIVLNSLVFAASAGDVEGFAEHYALHYGAGFTPVAWVMSNFVHRDIFHLLGNMIFLWGFGLIVEGKVGWLQFLSIYLGIGVVECILEQALFYQSEGMSFGASAIIFGLMVIALIWAPKNELSVFYWFFRFAGVFEISIITFALLHLLMSMASMILLIMLEVPVNSELLHLMGAGLGAIVGFFYLQTKLVDCEGWDILSVITGGTPTSEPYLSASFQEASRRRRNTRKAKRERPFEPDVKTNLEKATPERFNRFLQEKKAIAACNELERIRHLKPDWSPTADQLLLLARGLRTASQMKDAVTIYQEFLQVQPQFTLAHLELAEIFVFVQERPNAAKRLLDCCDLSTFSAKHQQRHQQAQRHAQSMIDDGVIEIDFRN